MSCGSSPLTRGKRARGGRISRRVRLIPAHAGKTLMMRSFIRHLPAHPRSRGENCACLKKCGIIAGSSPLTRGKLAARRRTPHPWGLIPAHAGKTDRVAHGLQACAGSSPLTRGKRRSRG